jgi:hypothetical protein
MLFFLIFTRSFLDRLKSVTPNDKEEEETEEEEEENKVIDNQAKSPIKKGKDEGICNVNQYLSFKKRTNNQTNEAKGKISKTLFVNIVNKYDEQSKIPSEVKEQMVVLFSFYVNIIR